MSTVTEHRTRAQIVADLAKKIHEAGRMTVNSPGYEPLHGEIDDLLVELGYPDTADQDG